MKVIIYRAQHVGLANRLRALVGYQAMSYFLDAAFYLWWTSDTWCNIDFTHLFDGSNIKTITPVEWNILKENSEISIFDEHCWFNEIWKTHLENRVPWLDFLRQATYHLGSLYPKRHIVDKIEHFSKLHNIQNAVGIHIRWTDNIKAYKFWTNGYPDFNPNYVSKLEGFQKYIENRFTTEPDLRIFLATDNKKIEGNFKKLYGNNVIVYPKKYKRRKLYLSYRKSGFRGLVGRTSSIEDALIEMLLLSRCQMILGTYFSSFSKFSAVWGNTDYFEVRGSDYTRSEFVDSLRLHTGRNSARDASTQQSK